MKLNRRVWGLITVFIMLFTTAVECGGGTPTLNPDLPVLALTPLIPHFGTPGTLGTLNPLGTLIYLGTPGPFVVEEYAPFCRPSYAPLCADPNLLPRDTPCTPGVLAGDVTLAGIGCPLNGVVRFDFDSNGGGNTGFYVVINGDIFTCIDSLSKPDVFSCTGPEQPMGKDAVIVVCGEGTTPTPTPAPAALTTESGIALANYLKTDLLNVSNMPLRGGGGGCLDGYIWKPDPNMVGGGECVLIADLDCPENWFVNALGTCSTDKESACPEGTTYDKRAGGCVPDKGECPPGWIITENKTCVPVQNDRHFCPRGYYYDKPAQCCLPIKGNNFGCDENSYYDISTRVCLPIDGNGCGINQVYDNFGKCVGIPGEEGSKEEKPAPGLVMRTGDLLGPGNLVIDDPKNGDPDCGPNATYLAAIKNCVNRDENGCPYAYHFDEKLNYCIPDDGTGSPCPLGYRYNERLGCCVPLPGFNGSRCPQDEKLAAAMAAGDLTFAASQYDPGEGICSPLKANAGPTPTPVPGTQQPECADYEYFDKELGYCVPLGPDCCPQGYGFSMLLNKCMPLLQDLEKHELGTCADGYLLFEGSCQLTGLAPVGGACTTIVKNVPQCIGGCEVGLTMVNGVCIKRDKPTPVPPNPCAGVVCQICCRNQICPAGCCTCP